MSWNVVNDDATTAQNLKVVKRECALNTQLFFNTTTGWERRKQAPMCVCNEFASHDEFIYKFASNASVRLLRWMFNRFVRLPLCHFSQSFGFVVKIY